MCSQTCHLFPLLLETCDRGQPLYQFMTIWKKNDSFCFNALTSPRLRPLVTNFIMKAFINGRKLFGTPFYPKPGTEVVRRSPTNQMEQTNHLNAVRSVSWGNRLKYLLFPLCSAAGLLLWLEGVDRRRVGAQWQVLPDLREDWTLHEGLSKETQVVPSLFACRMRTENKISIMSVWLYFVIS